MCEMNRPHIHTHIFHGKPSLSVDTIDNRCRRGIDTYFPLSIFVCCTMDERLSPVF